MVDVSGKTFDATHMFCDVCDKHMPVRFCEWTPDPQPDDTADTVTDILCSECYFVIAVGCTMKADQPSKLVVDSGRTS